MTPPSIHRPPAEFAVYTQMIVKSAYQKAPPWLRDRTHLLVRAGSHAAGVALPSSDVDLRGVAIAPRSYFLGFVDHFDRFTIDAPDAEVTNLPLFMHEACSGNLNALLCLWCDESDVLIQTGVGAGLRQLRSVFLSTRLVRPFLGYTLRRPPPVRTSPG